MYETHRQPMSALRLKNSVSRANLRLVEVSIWRIT
jgi:hypothetical protein